MVEPLSSHVPDGTDLPSTGEAEELVTEVQDEVLLVAGEEDFNDESIEDSSLGCPDGRDSADVEKLRADMVEDESLKHCWDLARADKMGYSTENELLHHSVVDGERNVRDRLVLPKCRR